MRGVMCAIVFDLDDTLLDTSMLREDRAPGRRDRLAARLDEVIAYHDDRSSLQAAELPARVKGLGFPVGILTHGPRWYAERLLDAFQIPYDALISGSDGYPRKPDPTSLRAIATDLGEAVEDCVIVGDDANDVGAGQNAGALSVGVAWSRRAPTQWRRCWPDVAVARPDRVIDVIENGGPRLAFAEAVLAGEQPLWHWGSLIRLGGGVYGAGRYFTTSDARHPHSALSRLIIEAKEGTDAAHRLGEMISGLAGTPWKGVDVDLVTSVPPKPGQDYDRFETIRFALARAIGVGESGEVLTQLFADEDYKHQRAEDRPALAEGRFQSRPLQGERVLLIDDVITSGGQAEECGRVMLANGAQSVTVLAFGVTQDRLPRECPQCGGFLRLVTSGYKPFIGCSNFGPLGCRYKESAPQL
jgi:HAD superfamily hydrolase (TIGR01549 family)